MWLMGVGALGVAGGGGSGTYVVAMPAGTSVEGRGGPILVATACYLGTGEDRGVASAATRSRRRLGAWVGVVLNKTIAAGCGALVHE